jgi:hypothetical protein
MKIIHWSIIGLYRRHDKVHADVRPRFILPLERVSINRSGNSAVWTAKQAATNAARPFDPHYN